MQPTANTETILLVDDEPSIREAMKDMLEQEGYKVLEAGNYYQAIDVAEWYTDPLDLLIADVSLPGPNGCELANRLRTMRPGCRVLFISGYTGAEIVLQYGMPLSDIHFLAKPITKSALMGRVRLVLDTERNDWDIFRDPVRPSRKPERR